MDFRQTYRIIHEFTLAMRGVCRTLQTRDARSAFDRMNRSQKEQMFQLARTGNVAGLRDLIRIVLASDDLTTMSYQLLRERASRLRIPKFNKMHKSDLINHIKVTEEVLRAKLLTLARPQPQEHLDVVLVGIQSDYSEQLGWSVVV